MKINNYILSWDTVVSIVTIISLYFLLPDEISTKFGQSIYNMGLTVISIIFSVFFASLAVIISTSDNDFVLFLEEENHFSILVSSFNFTLFSLFISLFYSIALFIFTQYQIESCTLFQSKYYFISFIGLFVYSLIATVLSVYDTLRFSKYRIKYFQRSQKLK